MQIGSGDGEVLYNHLSSSELHSRGLRSTVNVFTGLISPMRYTDDNKTIGCSFSP